MSDLTIGLLSALLATNQPQAVSNLVQEKTGTAIEVAASPAEKELRDLMIDDDATQDEVGDWIKTNTIPRSDAVGIEALNQRIRARLLVQRKAYEQFLRNHPDSAKGYLAFGSFLNDIGDEDAAKVQYENSKQLDPKNPAVWNNLANYFGEHGELTNAFASYTEAIRLDPNEPVYYQNFATTVYLYRTDARQFYNITEPQVFDKSLGLYRQAMKLDPQNFTLATDYAESFYGIRPLRTNDALAAWTNALNVAQDDNEREAVQIHLARVKIAAGFFEQASNHLAAVTNDVFGGLKARLERNLAEKINPPTNAVSEISTNILVEETNAAIAVTNIISVATNVSVIETNLSALSTNLLVAPPPLRESK